jgi:low affinity Fe/Cu permease
MEKHRARRWLTNLGVLTSRPWVFVVFLAYVAVWLIVSPGTLNFAAIAALFTWAMTLVIQRAQHRDTQAIHAKLDELLRVHGEARNELTSLDDEDAEEVEKKRDQIRDRIRSQ